MIFTGIEILFIIHHTSIKYAVECRGRWHGDVLIYTFPGCKESESQLELFWSEVALLSRLRHENLELFMGAVIEPIPCIVTSAKKGPSLYEKIHIRKEPLHLKDKMSIATQVAQAASYLHAKGIVLHRRLNSHNIFLESKVQLCLIDQRSINSNLYSRPASASSVMPLTNSLSAKCNSRSPPSSPLPLTLDTLAACCAASTSNVPSSRSSIASTCSTSSTESNSSSNCSRASKIEKLSSMFFSRSNSSSSGCGSNGSSPTNSPSPFGNHSTFNYLASNANSLSYSQYTFTHPLSVAPCVHGHGASNCTSSSSSSSSKGASESSYANCNSTSSLSSSSSNTNSNNSPFTNYQFTSPLNNASIREQLSYLAPELIRTMDIESIPSLSRCTHGVNDHLHQSPEAITTSKHTMATDVYAFGTILYELMTYKFPYSKLTSENIISRVSNGYHESVSKLKSCPTFWSDLIKSTWHANPVSRPSFKQICKILQASSKQTNQLVSSRSNANSNTTLASSLTANKSMGTNSSPLPLSCSATAHISSLNRQFSSSEPEKLNFDPESGWPWYWSGNTGNVVNCTTGVRKPLTPQHALYPRNH